ncbi:MAG: helix-turn-helix domain-containing protein [Luteolibacter sp.]
MSPAEGLAGVVRTTPAILTATRRKNFEANNSIRNMIYPGSNRLLVSMSDIARVVGVSHVAVSLALRDHPRISAEMRKKIRETAELLGYQPDPMLARLASFRNAKPKTSIRSAIGWITAS